MVKYFCDLCGDEVEKDYSSMQRSTPFYIECGCDSGVYSIGTRSSVCQKCYNKITSFIFSLRVKKFNVES